MLADKGYDSDDVRASLLLKGLLPVIPPKANRKQAITCDFRAYRDRNRVERMFNKLKQFRRIATRIRQDRSIVPGLPVSRRCKAMDAHLCQQGLLMLGCGGWLCTRPVRLTL